MAQEERNLLPEVLEFDAILAKHGIDLGWHPDDHGEFCRQHQAANGDLEACIAATSAQLFHMDPDAIAVHARCVCWHRTGDAVFSTLLRIHVDVLASAYAEMTCTVVP